MIRRFSLHCCLAIVSLSSFGQDKQKDKEPKLILSPGVSYQGHLFGELNMMYVTNINSSVSGPRVGIESNLNSTQFIYAPKIGYEFNPIFNVHSNAINSFTLRANGIFYVDNKKVDFRVLPEVGLSYFGLISLTYGYSIPFNSFKTDYISNNRMTLTVNLAFDKL